MIFRKDEVPRATPTSLCCPDLAAELGTLPEAGTSGTGLADTKLYGTFRVPREMTTWHSVTETALWAFVLPRRKKQPVTLKSSLGG